MVKVDLDTATAQKCKEIKRTVSWKEWLLVSYSKSGHVYAVKNWKPAIPVKRLKSWLKPSGILNLDTHRHFTSWSWWYRTTSSQTTPSPLCHLSELLGTSGDHRPLMPPEFLREGCKAKTSNLFGTTLLDFPCRSRNFTLAFKKIFPIIISMRYSGSLDSEPYLTLRRYMDQGIYFQCL